MGITVNIDDKELKQIVQSTTREELKYLTLLLLERTEIRAELWKAVIGTLNTNMGTLGLPTATTDELKKVLENTTKLTAPNEKQSDIGGGDPNSSEGGGPGGGDPNSSDQGGGGAGVSATPDQAAHPKNKAKR
jgi:hypothetical protein